MREQDEIEKQKYQRLKEIFALGRQRYLDAGGDPLLSGGSLNSQDYLTEAEKKEIIELGQEVFDRSSVKIKN
ncbi:hypothetical protein IQ272_11365 [Chroococcidiopsidales cyanobacterium LEGE 13417]|mgnify:CR=1 FL=1|nr:hypothetical protein [Chroococcidiopsidales cyanobacterium LEGE 13417]